MVFELREYLSAHIFTCLHTNFTFEHSGVTLNEYTELCELDLSHNPKIFMRPAKYDDKSARLHITKLVTLLETPSVLTNSVKVTKNYEESKSAQRSRSASFSEQDATSEQERKPSEQDERLKQNYEDFMQVIKSHQGETSSLQTPNIEMSKSQQAMSIFKELFSGAISLSPLKKLKHTRCVESIQFSTSQSVSDHRKIQGDLFYLTVKTLENTALEHGITCTVNGFFRNDSSHSAFSAQPSTKSNPCFSYTLAGCLHQMSQSFSRNMEVYFNSILNTEPFFLTPTAQPLHCWIDQPQPTVQVSSADQLGSTIVPLYGIDPKQMHDWNEEF